MASLYANENFPLKVAELLREMGHDVLTSREAGNANQGIADDEVLKFAGKSARILLTLNRRDFIALHSQNSNHAGIIVCTQNVNLNEQAELIHSALQETNNFTGQLIRISRKQK